MVSKYLEACQEAMNREGAHERSLSASGNVLQEYEQHKWSGFFRYPGTDPEAWKKYKEKKAAWEREEAKWRRGDV